MRTRFLCVDYFTPSSSSSLQTLESVPAFLRLPLPHLPSPPLSVCEEFQSCFDSVLSISLDIESLQIHNALSRFFSDVLPQNVPLRNGHFEITRSRSRKDSFDEERSFSFGSLEIRTSENETQVLDEEKEVESHRTYRSETPEKGNDATLGNENFSIFQFETPELCLFLENSCFSYKEEMQILSEFLEIENNLDMLRPGLAVQYPCEVHESVYSVQDVTLKYHMEQNTYLLEGVGSGQDQIPYYHGSFPLLEVDEISLGIFRSFSVKDEFLLHLESIEPQQWTQKDVLMADGEELLGSLDIDTLEYISDNFLSKQPLEFELSCQNLSTGMDVLSIMENSYNQGSSAFNLVISNGDSLLSTSPVLFEEFQILDVDSSQFLEAFIDSQSADELETCDQMFRDDVNFQNFNELIISRELALVDNTFKSLPIPILSDHEKMRSLHSIVEEIIAELKLQPLSASDGIYLDWQLLEEDKCKSDIFSTHWNILDEIDSYRNDLNQISVDDGTLVFDFVFSSDASNGPTPKENKVSLDLLSDGISLPKGHFIGVSSSKLLDNQCPKPGNGESLSFIDAEKVSLLSESISQFSDLDFFLNPRKGSAGGNSEPVVKTFKSKATCPVVSSGDSVTQCAPTAVQLLQWDIQLHWVNLSDNIVNLLDSFQQSYLAILENDTELKKTHSLSLAADNHMLLGLPKQLLVDCIKKTTAQQTSLVDRDKSIMAFVALCAIKYMAWYLCFYGIHTTHLYVDNLCQRLGCLKFRLSFLHSLIEDAYGVADRDIARSHPSLSVIQGILLSNITQRRLKALIVTDQVFWYPLKRLLTSMGISYNEQPNIHTHTNQPDECDRNGFKNTTMDALQHSDCLLVSHKHISASFPFNKFGIILEYGASCGLSRISTISPNSVGLPRLHFVKMEVEHCSIAKALCEGVDMPQEGESHPSLALNGNLNDQQLEELLNFVPIEDKCNVRSPEAADKLESCHTPLVNPCVMLAMECKQVQPRMPCFQDTVIVVNTHNFDREMIISRRSTYQRILAMEKEGAQVVERDSNLPVDIIICAAICLVWYDCRNLGKKATTLVEASSCLPFCVENIATNVLTLLSFSFSGCILVFEGEISFLSAIMESSDGLYAAAASLGINLQLFCSYSSDLTDEIVLSCIANATKLTRGLYPKMPESETLAESFLTKFPSINALTAHAIMSSVGLLVEFLKWSHERRIQAIRKYHVPDESVALLSALCRYGELEDSKSGMTDCSSSVSSAPDSEKSHFKTGSERKKRRHIGSTGEINIQANDLLHFVPLNEFPDGKLIASKASKPVDSHMSKSPHIFSETKRSNFSLNDKLFSQNQGLDIALSKNLDHHRISNSVDLHEDFIGEVIDFSESSLLGQDFLPIAKSTSLSCLVPEIEKEPVARNSKIARRLSFGENSHPSFPPAAEINSDSDIWNIVNDRKQNLGEGTGGYVDTDFSNDNMPLKHQKKLVEESSAQKSARNFHGLVMQDTEISHYGGTPFSNAVRSGQEQQGSPWTVEFLNRIREKRRSRLQSLPCDAPAPCFRYSGNVSSVAKRKSPSILDFYKYQGSSIPKKITEQKRQKRSIPSSTSSKSQGCVASLPTWTPIDKRARQTLSFAMNGSGSQTKLVWSNENAQGLRKRFRNQI